MSDTSVSRSVRVPADVDAALVAEAERLDRSVSWVMVRALRHALLDGPEGGRDPGWSVDVLPERRTAKQAQTVRVGPPVTQQKVSDALAEVAWKDLPPSQMQSGPSLEETLGLKKASELQPSAKRVFRCSVKGCEFSAGSAKARCPKHSGRLVEDF